MMALFDLTGGGKMVDKREAWLLSGVLFCIAGERSRIARGIGARPAGSSLQ